MLTCNVLSLKYVFQSEELQTSATGPSFAKDQVWYMLSSWEKSQFLPSSEPTNEQSLSDKSQKPNVGEKLDPEYLSAFQILEQRPTIRSKTTCRQT